MAMVSEMVVPGGVRVRVFDDLYRDASPEEIRRRRGEVYRALVEMIAEQQEQERERRTEAGGCGDPHPPDKAQTQLGVGGVTTAK